MATPEHLPRSRGFDTSLLYFHHANDYFSEKTHNVSDTCPHDVYPNWPARPPGGCFVDLWDGDAPARGQNGTVPLAPHAHQANVSNISNGSAAYVMTGPEQDYEEFKFKSRVLGIIGAHDAAASPLFSE